MKILYYLIVHYSMCFILMSGIDVMHWFDDISNSRFLYAVMSVTFLALIFTLPLVVLGKSSRK